MNSFAKRILLGALPAAVAVLLTACGGGAESSPTFEPLVAQADYTTAAGQAFRVVSGANAPLNCVGPADSTYQWVIENNGGLPIELSSATTAKSGFTAPIVTTATPVTLACRMTVTRTIPASGNIAASTTSTVVVSRVSVTIDPLGLGNTLVTTITGNKTVAPGARLTLTAASAWYDTNAKATTGPLINFAWTLGPGAPDGTFLTPATGSGYVDVVLPVAIMNPVKFPVTVTATSGTQTTQSTVTVLVDPAGGVNVAVTPLAQSVQSGAVVSLTATKAPSLYYQWSIVDGPAVTLGGASTNAVGFVAPTVTAPTNMTLRVAVGYSPITATNPGVYFFDGVVTVKP